MNRRRLLIPCIVIWATLAWLTSMGTTSPLDPTPQAWAHATQRLLLVLTSGSVLVWPATLCWSQSFSGPTVLSESITIAVLLGAAVVSVLLPGGWALATACAAAALLSAWVLAVGGICVLAHGARHRWPLLIFAAATLLMLPLAVVLPSPGPLLTGPLSAAWAIHAQPAQGLLWACTGVPLLLAGITWRATCLSGLFRRGSYA